MAFTRPTRSTAFTRPIATLTTNFSCSPGCWPEGQYCYCGESRGLVSMRGVADLGAGSTPLVIGAGLIAAYYLFFKR